MKSRLVRYTFLMSLLSLAACGGGGGGGDVSAVPATSSDPTSSYVAPTTTTAPTSTTAPTQPADATVEAPSKWEPPVLLQSIGDKGMWPYGADVAFDLNGNALAVWQRYDGTIESIWASRYSAQSATWSTPEVISDPTITQGAFPRIEFDNAGNAMAVWEVSYGSIGEIWANYYSAATGSWRTAAIVDDKRYPESFRNADFGFDGAGNVLIVWDQIANQVTSIWFNTYDAASGLWGTSKTIESDDVGTARLPKIAVDQNGNALAVWEHDDGIGTRTNIMANRYTAATKSWGTPALLESQDLDDCWSPDIAIDPNGNAIAVWEQGNGTDNDAVARRYVAATDTWGTPTLLETLEDDVAYVRIVVDASGNALALWMQALTYNGTPSIFSTRYDAATGSWSTAAVIENSDYTSIYPKLTIGANGNAMATWEERTTGHQVANYYDATTKTWGVAAPVESGIDTANYGAVAVAPDGTAVAVWTQSEALWASRYQP